MCKSKHRSQNMNYQTHNIFRTRELSNPIPQTISKNEESNGAEKLLNSKT